MCGGVHAKSEPGIPASGQRLRAVEGCGLPPGAFGVRDHVFPSTSTQRFPVARGTQYRLESSRVLDLQSVACV